MEHINASDERSSLRKDVEGSETHCFSWTNWKSMLCRPERATLPGQVPIGQPLPQLLSWPGRASGRFWEGPSLSDHEEETQKFIPCRTLQLFVRKHWDQLLL